MEKVKYTRNEYRNEYLKSDEWKKLRSIILGNGCDCQCCKKVKASDVHHMLYRNIVDITIQDLIPVCRSCHVYIHQAIEDGYISQEPIDFENIKRKTYGIIEDEDYIRYREWLGGKHFLREDEIENIKKLQAFVIKKISALVKKNLWYDDLSERKFTGRQILKIRQIIEVARYRRKNNLDKQRSKGFMIIRHDRKYNTLFDNSSMKSMGGFKSR